MKGVILSAGRGVRIRPLTDPIAKDMLPVYNKPMIIYLIKSLVEAGVDEILLVVYFPVNLYKRMLKQQHFYEIVTLVIDKRLEGPGRSLLLAEEWVAGEDFVLVLGDSVFFSDLPKLSELRAPHLFVMHMDDKEDDLSKYGQVRVFGSKVIKKVDKPEVVFSNTIQVSLWILPADIFTKAKLFSAIGEVRISALVDMYINNGLVDCTFLPSNSYLDCGTMEALFKANVKMRERVICGKPQSLQEISVL